MGIRASGEVSWARWTHVSGRAVCDRACVCLVRPRSKESKTPGSINVRTEMGSKSKTKT